MPNNDFATLFDWLPLGAYRSSLEGRQLRANPALVRLNGFDSEAEMLASVNDIAGITNDAGNVVGLMPHPDRASDPALGNTDGTGFFSSLLSWAPMKGVAR